jgi:hypothetical protein
VTDGQISEQFTVNTNRSKTKIPEEVVWRHDMWRSDDEVKEFSNGSRCNIGCSAMRKLFAENSFIETKGHFVGGKEVPICDDGVAGLSYIDSQEPGDLSQADALLCVQKLIEESKVLFDEVDLGKIDRRRGFKVWPRKPLMEAPREKAGFLTGMTDSRTREEEIFSAEERKCFLVLQTLGRDPL